MEHKGIRAYRVHRIRCESLFLLFLAVAFICSACGGGSNPSPSPYPPSPRQLHSFSRGSAGFYYNPPTLVGNYLYIGTSKHYNTSPATDNYFFKLDKNLNKIWEYSLGSKEVRGSTCLDSDSNIYFVIEVGRLAGDTSHAKNYLYSLDSNGNFRWQKDITPPDPSWNMWGMFNPAIATDDTIYIGGGKFYALNKATGSEEWTYNANLDIKNAPIIDSSGNIYFTAEDINSLSAKVFSLTSTGSLRWTFTPSSPEGTLFHLSSPAFSTNEARIYTPLGQAVYCLNASSGAEIWKFKPSGISGNFLATPAVDNNNNIYVGTKANENSVFYAIKADGSGLLWQNAIGADLYSSPCLGNDNTLYVGSENNSGGYYRIHALNMTTGTVEWTAPANFNVIWCSPVLDSSGVLYIGSMAESADGGSGGILYSLQTDSTSLLSGAGSARFHEGNASTGRRN